MKILSKKEQKKVCQEIVANTIMAFNLLDFENTDAKRVIEYTEHLINNTMDAVRAVGGWNAMLEAKETICRYQKRKVYAPSTETPQHADDLHKDNIAPNP